MAYGDGSDDGGDEGGGCVAQIVVHIEGADMPHAILVFDGEGGASMLLPTGVRSRELLALLFEAAAKDVRTSIAEVRDPNQLTLKDILNKRHGKESRKDET